MKSINIDFAYRTARSARKEAIIIAIDALIQGLILIAFFTLCAGVMILIK